MNPTEKIKEIEKKWVFVRNLEIRGIFNNRKEAVKFFKDMLRQTLKDLKNQDKTDEYNYSIEVPKMEIKPVEEREAEFGLI